MRKALLTVATLAVVALAVALLGQRLFTRTTREPSPAALGESSPGQPQPVQARGLLVPVRWTRLSLSASGQLEELTVSTDDTVSTGQELASLATQGLEVEVQLAQSELEAQQANLARLQEGFSEAEITAAKASYEAAVAAYEELKAGPSTEERAIAEADLKKAERAVQRAQAAYDAVRSLPDIGARPESMELEMVTLDYERAKAAYQLATSGPSDAMLKQSESQVASTKAQLDELTRAQPSETQAAQAGVARAKASLAHAQLALVQATLRAPFAGTVTSMADVAPGQMIGPGTTILTLADLTQMQVETIDLDEYGAATIRLNQSVDLWVPSLDNRSLRGRLIFVAKEPLISSNGATFYKAVIALETQAPDLRWGMTVRIRFGLPTGRAGG